MNDQKTALSTPALVLGVLSFAMSLFAIALEFMLIFLAMPVAIVGVILGHIALSKDTDDRKAFLGLFGSYATIAIFFGSFIIGMIINS